MRSGKLTCFSLFVFTHSLLNKPTRRCTLRRRTDIKHDSTQTAASAEQLHSLLSNITISESSSTCVFLQVSSSPPGFRSQLLLLLLLPLRSQCTNLLTYEAAKVSYDQTERKKKIRLAPYSNCMLLHFFIFFILVNIIYTFSKNTCYRISDLQLPKQ